MNKLLVVWCLTNICFCSSNRFTRLANLCILGIVVIYFIILGVVWVEL